MKNRFYAEVDAFAEEMKRVLNQPKNLRKTSDINNMTISDLHMKYVEEKRELEVELRRAHITRAHEEAVDLANVLMLIWTKLRRPDAGNERRS